MTKPSIFGYHPVREALANRPGAILEVLAAASDGKRSRRLEGLARRRGVVWRTLSHAQLTELCEGGVHNGFAATLDEGRNSAATPTGGDAELVVLVEDVQDPRNLGALLRVCEGAGVGRVLIRDRGSAPMSATVTKAAAGATEWLAVDRVTNSAQAIEEHKRAGFWVFGAVTDGVAPWSCDLTGKVLVCVGGEQRGLRQRTRSLCDHFVTLPMKGRVGSLNLATAASALLYEAVRQRQ